METTGKGSVKGHAHERPQQIDREEDAKQTAVSDASLAGSGPIDWRGFPVSDIAFIVHVRKARWVLDDKSNDEIGRIVKQVLPFWRDHQQLTPVSGTITRDQMASALVLAGAHSGDPGLVHSAHNLIAAITREPPDVVSSAIDVWLEGQDQESCKVVADLCQRMRFHDNAIKAWQDLVASCPGDRLADVVQGVMSALVFRLPATMAISRAELEQRSAEAGQLAEQLAKLLEGWPPLPPQRPLLLEPLGAGDDRRTRRVR